MAARKPQSGLSSALAERRRRQEGASDTHKQRASTALERSAHYRTAELLGNDIAVALSEQIEELNTYHHGFRSALQRVFVRVLRLAVDQADRVMLFHEAVPGFTLMLFKKEGWLPVEDAAVPLAPALDASAEGRAAEVLIGEYVQRTGKRVIIIEHVDSLFVFFPAEDLRKNVRELGYFAIE